RPVRAAARGGRSPAQDRRHQGAVPPCPRGEGRDRTQGRGAAISRQHVPQPRGTYPLYRGASAGRTGAARPEGRAVRGLGKTGATAQGHRGAAAQTRRDRGGEKGGVIISAPLRSGSASAV